jgi:hypothetical protein
MDHDPNFHTHMVKRAGRRESHLIGRALRRDLAQSTYPPQQTFQAESAYNAQASSENGPDADQTASVTADDSIYQC